MLRVICNDDSADATIRINGKVKGECPVDISIAEGEYTIRAEKKVDDKRVRKFEKDFSIGEGIVKKLEISLGKPVLTDEAARLAEQQSRQQIDLLRSMGFELQKSHRDCDDCPEMMPVPGGDFVMGDSFARPEHSVSVSAFLMGKYEVTQREWRMIMGTNPSYFKTCGDTCPVEEVNWNDVQEFIRRLNLKTGKTYRLPSEAEWEYACRAGTRDIYCGGENADALAWYDRNSSDATHAVGSKNGNLFGLFDMSGNVREWTQDCWNDNYNGASSTAKATESGDCSRRVMRGGYWGYLRQDLEAASRVPKASTHRSHTHGFRLARTLP